MAPLSSAGYPLSISDYELGDVIGKGGFGVVYRAVSKHMGVSYGKEVAIKMLDKDLITKTNMTRRVMNEVSIHASLHHPSILTLHAYFEDQKYVYLIMDLCDTGELYQYIQQRRVNEIQLVSESAPTSSTPPHLSEAEARGVMERIVKGVEYLHGRRIIHRDLKLSNILLNRFYEVKIADFGLAVRINDPEGEQKTMCGTPNYISPEIVSRQPYGLSSDIWSLGCMLVTMLTGRPPFDSKAVKNTLDKVSRAEYYLPESLSKEARDLIQQLLLKDPKKRLRVSDILYHPWFQLPQLPLKPLSHQNSHHSQSNNHNSQQSHYERQPEPESHSTTIPKTSAVSNSLQHIPNYISNKPQASANYLIQSEPPAAQPTGNLAESTNIASSTPIQKKADISTPQSQLSKPIDPSQSLRTTPASSVVERSHPSTQIKQSTDATFTTERLKPLKQKTKHGLVAILSNGNVVLDFKEERYVIVINRSGTNIFVCERRQSPSDANEDYLSLHVLQSYEKNNMPSWVMKSYRYAIRFVDLVRSKTPKVIFHSPQAKCMLMENTPYPDFEMHFTSGLRIHTSTTRNTLTLTPPPTASELSPLTTSLSTPFSLASVYHPHLIHLQDCLKTCLDVAMNPASSFPVILKSSAAGIETMHGTHRDSQAAQSLSTNEGLSLRVSTIGTCTSAAPSIVGQNHRQEKQQEPHLQPQLRHSVRMSSVPSTVSAGVTGSTAWTGREPGVLRSGLSRELSGSVNPSLVSVQQQSKEKVKSTLPVFLEHVGWCLRRGDVFSVFFLDGIWVDIEACGGALVVWDRREGGGEVVEKGHGSSAGCGSGIRYVIDKSLPMDVKEKLKFFPKFLEKMQMRK